MRDKYITKTAKRVRRKAHIRKKVSGTAEKPRLAVFRSANNIYAQLIDDVHNRTLTGVSTLSPELQKQASKEKGKISAAKLVGKVIAEKATKLKIEKAVFDRGGYTYHGRVRALAEAARENGLKF
ncbi:MAG: 50S ribosomal protein L18 [bacterium]